MLYILYFLGFFGALAAAIPLEGPKILPIQTAPRDFEPLQVLCKVNGFTLPAIVDTGAQVSIMTSGCAQRCRVSPFIDSSFSGKAIGVGSDDVIGEIRDLPVQIGSATASPRIAILRGGAGSRVDFIIGMDLLRKFRSEISLKDNTLRLHTVGKTHTVPFLNKVVAADSISAEGNSANGEQKEKDATMLEAKTSLSAMSTDVTRARIADAVNSRHHTQPKPVLVAACSTPRRAQENEAPVAELGENSDENNNEEGDEKEEDEDDGSFASDEETEMVSLEGY